MRKEIFEIMKPTWKECLIVTVIMAIIATAIILSSCSGGTSTSDIPDATLRIWMKGSDFHCCGINLVTVYLNGKVVGILRDKGIGSEWTVEVKAYVKAGRHNIRGESNPKPDGSEELWNHYMTINANQGYAALRLECASSWCGN